MPYEFNHTKTDSFEDYLRRHLEWGHATFGTPADGCGPPGPQDSMMRSCWPSPTSCATLPTGGKLNTVLRRRGPQPQYRVVLQVIRGYLVH